VTSILAANDGGHISQLKGLLPQLPIVDDVLWLTPKTPQTESLLEAERTVWLDPSPTRDWRAVLRNARIAHPVLRQVRPRVVVSTGASVALSVLPLARAMRIRTVYIESATRLDGPSVSGRILAALPGGACFTQQERWQSARWRYSGSVFDGYETYPRSGSTGKVARVVVSLGTSETYRFDRLVSRLREILPNDAEVVWQTGATAPPAGTDDSNRYMSYARLRSAIEASDCVIAHAGTGIALTCLLSGKMPVLVPRQPTFGEHVDDHQEQIARFLEERGLAIVRDVERLGGEALQLASAMTARQQSPTSASRWW
jgi:UDP-N-acetylglucosamine--N-acetylmuramyl-(pentapeptide) pyrophosphoryl-undecaprenol N-acetylglucosamine transferase